MEYSTKSNRSMDRQVQLIGLCVLAYIFISIPVIFLSPNFIHIAMVWNLGLAFLPLVFAKLLEKTLTRTGSGQEPAGSEKKSKTETIKVLCLGLLWLFFFPNAPYMITDFIHLSGISFYSRADSYAPVIYSTDIVSWIELVHIGLGVFLGILAGLLSLSIVHRLVLKRKNRFTAHGVLVLICLLSGYAIYMGRFLRFNSWDILQPVSLLSELMRATNGFSLMFSLVFAVYILISYVFFHAFFPPKSSN